MTKGAGLATFASGIARLDSFCCFPLGHGCVFLIFFRPVFILWHRHISSEACSFLLAVEKPRVRARFKSARLLLLNCLEVSSLTGVTLKVARTTGSHSGISRMSPTNCNKSESSSAHIELKVATSCFTNTCSSVLDSCHCDPATLEDMALTTKRGADWW